MHESMTVLASGAGSSHSLGGGTTLVAIVAFAWLLHYVHRFHVDNKAATGGKAKHDPRRWVVLAFILGILLTVGTGELSNVINSGATHVGSMLG